MRVINIIVITIIFTINGLSQETNQLLSHNGNKHTCYELINPCNTRIYNYKFFNNGYFYFYFKNSVISIAKWQLKNDTIYFEHLDTNLIKIDVKEKRSKVKEKKIKVYDFYGKLINSRVIINGNQPVGKCNYIQISLNEYKSVKYFIKDTLANEFEVIFNVPTIKYHDFFNFSSNLYKYGIIRNKYMLLSNKISLYKKKPIIRINLFRKIRKTKKYLRNVINNFFYDIKDIDIECYPPSF